MPIDLQTSHPAVHERFQSAIADAHSRLAEYEAAGAAIRQDVDQAIRAHNIALSGSIKAGLKMLGIGEAEAKELAREPEEQAPPAPSAREALLAKAEAKAEAAAEKEAKEASKEASKESHRSR
jgi:hypothetical protein